jgi:hypothetical protein
MAVTLSRQPGKNIGVCVAVIVHPRFKRERESDNTHPGKSARLMKTPPGLQSDLKLRALRSAVRSDPPFVIQIFWGIPVDKHHFAASIGPSINARSVLHIL